MDIPKDLKHKPVIVCENYENIDGRSAYHSEAKGLSLGLAQWNDRGKVDISAKVWRHTGGKWSRQSEELPLHRVLDLAILVCPFRRPFSGRPIVIPLSMIRSIPRLTVSAYRGTQ